MLRHGQSKIRYSLLELGIVSVSDLILFALILDVDIVFALTREVHAGFALIIEVDVAIAQSHEQRRLAQDNVRSRTLELFLLYCYI